MRPHPRPSRRVLKFALLMQAPLDRSVPPIANKAKPADDQPDLLADKRETKDTTVSQK